MRNLYEIFKILHFQEKNSFRGNYLRNYGSSQDVDPTVNFEVFILISYESVLSTKVIPIE